MNDTVIRTNRIGKTYRNFAAVSDLNLDVNRGDIYALVGQNGAGKTTLLKMICGLTAPTSGSLELFGGTSQKQLGDYRARLGAMVETPGFFPYLSARENLEYYRIQRGRKMTDIESTLQFVGLDNTGRKKFKNFSLGMKQRLGLALAIMNEPEILVLDEPINGLDPKGIKEFRDIILRLNQEKRTTVLISSHILGELSQIATTYGFIDKGRLIEHITAQELKEKCRSYLRIDVNDTAAAAGILRDKLGCTALEIAGENTLHITENFDAPENFVKALVENSVMVSQVVSSGVSLEQYFLNLIGGEKNA